jgi:hypothetical protein
MKKSLFVLGGVLAASFASANLVTNGGFETNNWGGTVYDAIQAGGPNTGDLPDWTVLGNTDRSGIDIVGTYYSPHSGSFAVDLAGTPGPGGIAQALATGTGQYQVSFWARSSDGSGINTIVDSGLIGPLSGTGLQTVPNTFTINQDWNLYSYIGSAAGASTLVLETSPLNTTNGNVFVDDVQVNPVPEPCSVLGLGLGVLALVRKRKSK